MAFMGLDVNSLDGRKLNGFASSMLYCVGGSGCTFWSESVKHVAVDVVVVDDNGNECGCDDDGVRDTDEFTGFVSITSMDCLNAVES